MNKEEHKTVVEETCGIESAEGVLEVLSCLLKDVKVVVLAFVGGGMGLLIRF